MSIKIMTQVERLIKSNSLKFSGPTKFVLMTLAKIADNDGKKIYPSHKTLADRTGYCVRTIQTHLRILESLGLIKIQHHFINGYQSSNHYFININNLTALLKIQERDLSKKTVDKSVDNTVENSETLMVVGGAATLDKSSNHDIYIKENNYTESERKLFYSELLSIRIFEKEVVKLIKRHGISKIIQVKRKIEDLIRKGKIIVKNFGAYLRRCLDNDYSSGLKPLINAMAKRFTSSSIKPVYHNGIRMAPQDFKDLGPMLKNMLPNS